MDDICLMINFPMCNSLSPDRRIRWWAASFRCPVALWKEKSFAFLAENMLAQGHWRVCRGPFFARTGWQENLYRKKPTGKPLDFFWVEEKMQKLMMPMKPFHWTSADSGVPWFEHQKIISWLAPNFLKPPNLNFHRNMFPTFSTCSQRKPQKSQMGDGYRRMLPWFFLHGLSLEGERNGKVFGWKKCWKNPWCLAVYRHCPYTIPAWFSKFHGVWRYIVIVPKKTSSIIEVNDVKRLLMSSHLGNYHHMDSSLLIT